MLKLKHKNLNAHTAEEINTFMCVYVQSDEAAAGAGRADVMYVTVVATHCGRRTGRRLRACSPRSCASSAPSNKRHHVM